MGTIGREMICAREYSACRGYAMLTKFGDDLSGLSLLVVVYHFLVVRLVTCPVTLVVVSGEVCFLISCLWVSYFLSSVRLFKIANFN